MRRKVRDIKCKEKFFIEDVVVAKYAKFWGWKAVLVYVVLCRHANTQQVCFPSVRTISKELGISKDSVHNGINTLIANHVIEKSQSRWDNNVWKNNTYRLLNKSNWKLDSFTEKFMGDVEDHPYRHQQSPIVAQSVIKETNIKVTNIRSSNKLLLTASASEDSYL